MMKKILNLVIALLCCYCSMAQAPFTTLVKEPIVVIKKSQQGRTVFSAADSMTTFNFLNKKSTSGQQIDSTKKSEVDFFSNNSLALSILNKGDARASISSEVLHYKLYFADPNSENTYRLNRYNIPILIITKLSTSYDTVKASSALDVLDYQASPITIRMMPSWRKAFRTYNDVVYLGFYTDLRGINIYNLKNNSYDLAFVGSGGAGFTYQSSGAAGTYNVKGEYEPGKYSFSVILQGAIGDNDTFNRLFNCNKHVVGSVQSYLIFKIGENNKLNFKFSYQYLFQKTISGVNNNISLALGI